MISGGISNAVIHRLPRYYRYIRDMYNENVERVSSQELSLLMKTTASQVRQDFNMFGGFGQQGYGYNVQTLYKEIGDIIGVNQCRNIIIIGAGNLGQALMNYMNFPKFNFEMKGMFDINPRLIGLVVRGIEIQPLDDLESFLMENKVEIAALTLPRTQAREVAERLVQAGIKAIWNFAPIDLDLPDDVVVENVHLTESLMQLVFRCNHM